MQANASNVRRKSRLYLGQPVLSSDLARQIQDLQTIWGGEPQKIVEEAIKEAWRKEFIKRG